MRSTPPPAALRSRIRSKAHRARPQGGRDWGTRIGFNPGPSEPFIDPMRAAAEAAANAAKRESQ